MNPIHGLDRAARRAAQRVLGLAARGRGVTCPVCEESSRFFLPFGVGRRIRLGAQCRRCHSLERDRAAWLHLTASRAWLAEGTRLLHVAPEPCFEPRLRRRLGAGYVTVDLQRIDVDHRASIESLPFEGGAFDAIICNHVLEHVQDDRKAMAELRRVLSPSGWALLQVPLDADREMTDEDPSVASPEERSRRFGQHDHVRTYGRDYVTRLRAVGFVADVRSVRVHHTAQEIERYGLDPSEALHFCWRG